MGSVDGLEPTSASTSGPKHGPRLAGRLGHLPSFWGLSSDIFYSLDWKIAPCFGILVAFIFNIQF